MGKIIGIDLGTTNSCVAVFEGGEPTVITNPEGARTTPSVVAFSKTGERMVGQVAKRQSITNPDRTVSSIKREMGTGHTVEIDGKKYTPQEISAMILQKLKADAEAFLGTPVTQAVITVANTAKEVLHVSAEDLMGRFVRGDRSRNTEGSGLGLSIAKSLTELQGGGFSLRVSEDQFAAVITFPLKEKVQESQI